jgi:hypothetical protein
MTFDFGNTSSYLPFIVLAFSCKFQLFTGKSLIAGREAFYHNMIKTIIEPGKLHIQSIVWIIGIGTNSLQLMNPINSVPGDNSYCQQISAYSDQIILDIIDMLYQHA